MKIWVYIWAIIINGAEGRDKRWQHYRKTAFGSKFESAQTGEFVRRWDQGTVPQMQRNIYATTNISRTIGSS